MYSLCTAHDIIYSRNLRKTDNSFRIPPCLVPGLVSAFLSPHPSVMSVEGLKWWRNLQGPFHEIGIVILASAGEGIGVAFTLQDHRHDGGYVALMDAPLSVFF